MRGASPVARIAVGASTLLTASAALLLGMPWYWVLAFAAAVASCILALPRAVARSVASLDRTMQRHMQRRELPALLPAYRAARLARLFAPRTDMRLRLAHILIETGDAARAREVVENALIDADEAELPRLLAPLVRARFLDADDDGTVKAFRMLAENGTPMSIHVYAAVHAALAAGRPAGEAESFLERHLGGAIGSDAHVAALARARLALRRGRAPEADGHLAGCDESKLPREIRTACRLTRAEILLASGKEDDGRALLEEIAGTTPPDRFSVEARKTLGTGAP